MMRYLKQLVLVASIAVTLTSISGTCVGRFLNPITDVCWSCLFPITIGGIPFAPSSKFKDTDNPVMPVCGCKKDLIPVPIPGVTLGVWEPVRVVEITRTPYCLVSLGGSKIKSSSNHGSFKKTRSEQSKTSNAYYHIHYYAYPLLSVLSLVVDVGCLTVGSYDIAYLSELDPSHRSDSLANFMHPETFLLSNPVAVTACTADCIAATANKQAIDSLFWCSGCQGSIYPFTGFAGSHVGGVGTSSLLATRQLAKLHRMGLAKRTATNYSAVNGELCDSSYAYRIPKSQYRLQMTFPRPNVSGGYSCNPIGMLDSTYSSGREFPYSGEDFVYLVWRKRNCCWRTI